ncbi:hypothetical protein cypCar_00039497 [Cyprinus carpio]|nr:hypothetical protein cypCar_00039497 [Cyprinus carpio]
MPSFRKIKREHKGNSKVDPEIKDSSEEGDEREGFQQKRSKSTDNLNLRMKLAMAHKSLSSLFESRYPERDNQEQIAQSENEEEQSEDRKYLEGGELPCAPYLDSDQISEDGFESSVEDRSQSPVHPTVFALANQMSPTWTRSLSCFETTDTPTRPMSPKPHSPGLGWTHRRSFRYPSRSVASSLCSLGQGVSTDGISDPPQRPTSLKPRTAQLTTTHSFDSESLLEDSSSDSQSQNSLNSASLINKPEVRARLSLTSPEQFPSVPLKDHFFSQSTPVGLDFLGWPHRASFSGGNGYLHSATFDNPL